MNAMLSIGQNQVVTTPSGLIMFMPTSISISHSNSDFSRIEVSGVIVENDQSKANRLYQLKNFTIIELMEEVQHRIKSGENKKERRK